MKIKRKYVLRFLLSTVTVVIFLELFARFYLGLGTPPLTAYHPTIEYLFKPNQDVYRFHNHFLVNEFGMRSSQFHRTKQPGEYRVMVFGDSVINGGNLTDHEALATTKLQRLIEQHSESRPAIIGNISAGSWGPGNWLAYLREYGAFDADVIVLIISSHDIADNPTFKSLSSNTHPTHTPPLAIIEAATRYLPRYLPAFLQANEVQEDLSANGPNTSELEKGQEDLKAFLELALRSSPKVLVYQHWTKSEIDAGMALPGNGLISKICRDLGIEPISLAPELRRAIEAGESPYRDDIHVNEIGQQLLSEVLAENLGFSSK